MASNDFEDVRLHATQTFEAVERSYNKISRGKRFLINAAVCLLFFIAGFSAARPQEQVQGPLRPPDGIRHHARMRVREGHAFR